MSDIALGLDRLLPAAEYRGSLTDNSQAAFDALVWEDARPKPAWSAIETARAELEVENLYAYAAEKRWQAETGGIVSGGVPVPTDGRAKTLIAGAASSSKADAEIIKFKVAGSWTDLTLAQIRAIQDAITTHVQACFDAESAVSALIADGTYTTNAQIDAHAWPSNS